MLQGALNSANAISKAANELELAAQLANLFQHGVPLKEAKSKVQASTTVEPQLLANLCYFITHYAGGDTFPFIDFLQKFSALPVFVPFGITPKPCGISCVINVYMFPRIPNIVSHVSVAAQAGTSTSSSKRAMSQSMEAIYHLG